MGVNVNKTSNKPLNSAKNLSDLASIANSRTNLAVYSTAEVDAAIAAAIVAANPANGRTPVELATTSTPAFPSYTGGGTGILTVTGATALSLDGVAVVNGDRVLIKDMVPANSRDNGIYVVSGVGSEVVLTRSADANTTAEVPEGMFLFVKGGLTNADMGFVVITAPAALNTDPIAFTQFTENNVTDDAGLGLVKNGTTFSLRYGKNSFNIGDFSIPVGDNMLVNGKTGISALGDNVVLPDVVATFSAIGSTPILIKDESGSASVSDFIRVESIGTDNSGIDDVDTAAALTSGVLVIGRRYNIVTLNAGDDFTNVGFVSVATPFIATGTTPTTWTNLTEVYEREGIKITVPYGSLKVYTDGTNWFTE